MKKKFKMKKDNKDYKKILDSQIWVVLGVILIGGLLFGWRNDSMAILVMFGVLYPITVTFYVAKESGFIRIIGFRIGAALPSEDSRYIPFNKIYAKIIFIYSFILTVLYTIFAIIILIAGL